MTYELWDIPSRNIVDVFHAKEDIAEIVRHAIEDDGPEAIDTFVVMFANDDGSYDGSLAGQALLDFVNAVPVSSGHAYA